MFGAEAHGSRGGRASRSLLPRRLSSCWAQGVAAGHDRFGRPLALAPSSDEGAGRSRRSPLSRASEVVVSAGGGDTFFVPGAGAELALQTAQGAGDPAGAGAPAPKPADTAPRSGRAVVGVAAQGDTRERPRQRGHVSPSPVRPGRPAQRAKAPGVPLSRCDARRSRRVVPASRRPHGRGECAGEAGTASRGRQVLARSEDPDTRTSDHPRHTLNGHSWAEHTGVARERAQRG